MQPHIMKNIFTDDELDEMTILIEKVLSWEPNTQLQ